MMGKLLLTTVPGSWQEQQPLVPPVDGLRQLLDAVVNVHLLDCAVPPDGLGAEVLGTELVVGQIGPMESTKVLEQV
jgi:hypothetical protein